MISIFSTSAQIINFKLPYSFYYCQGVKKERGIGEQTTMGKRYFMPKGNKIRYTKESEPANTSMSNMQPTLDKESIPLSLTSLLVKSL